VGKSQHPGHLGAEPADEKLRSVWGKTRRGKGFVEAIIECRHSKEKNRLGRQETVSPRRGRGELLSAGGLSSRGGVRQSRKEKHEIKAETRPAKKRPSSPRRRRGSWFPQNRSSRAEGRRSSDSPPGRNKIGELRRVWGTICGRVVGRRAGRDVENWPLATKKKSPVREKDLQEGGRPFVGGTPIYHTAGEP